MGRNQSLLGTVAVGVATVAYLWYSSSRRRRASLEKVEDGDDDDEGSPSEVATLKELRYRITGKQSVERLTPLLADLVPGCKWRAVVLGESLPAATTSNEEEDRGHAVELVWETTCEADMRQTHAGARVWNKLHNNQILEDKSNLALLQQRMTRPMLTTFVAIGKEEVLQWAEFMFAGHGRAAPAEALAQLRDELAARATQDDWWFV